jgi:hypothetical protein
VEAMALEARILAERTAFLGPMISWVGPCLPARTPAPTDGWPHPGHEGQVPCERSDRTWDDASNTAERLSPERGSRTGTAGRSSSQRRRLPQPTGGGQGDVRLALRRHILHRVGGVLLLLSPLMNGLDECGPRIAGEFPPDLPPIDHELGSGRERRWQGTGHRGADPATMLSCGTRLQTRTELPTDASAGSMAAASGAGRSVADCSARRRRNVAPGSEATARLYGPWLAKDWRRNLGPACGGKRVAMHVFCIGVSPQHSGEGLG